MQTMVALHRKRKNELIKHKEILTNCLKKSLDDCKDLFVLDSMIHSVCVIAPELSHKFVLSVGKLVFDCEMIDLAKIYAEMAAHDKMATDDDELSVFDHGHSLKLCGYACINNAELYDKLLQDITNVYNDCMGVIKEKLEKIDKALSNYITIGA